MNCLHWRRLCAVWIWPAGDWNLITVYITQGRSPKVPGLLFGMTSKCWLCLQVCRALLHALTQTHIHVHLELQSDTRTILCTNIRLPSLSTPSGHLLCSRYFKLLCRWSYVFAAIRSRTESCHRQLSKTVPKRRLLGQPARTNSGMGRVTCEGHEPHVHGRSIL